jgi:hypothetical protein
MPFMRCEKYGRTSEPTCDVIILYMHFACWITEATDTHLEYVILIVFLGLNGYANTPQSYVYMYIACLAHKEQLAKNTWRENRIE